MKRVSFLGLLVLFLFLGAQAQAKNVDTLEWLSGDYVGVGSVNMERFGQRKLFDELISFFLTDSDTKKAFSDLEAAGFNLKKDVARIVVGVPADVERGAHLVIFESKKDLEPYRALLASDHIDKRLHSEVEYYCTKRNNECMVVNGQNLVVGSEARVKAVVDVIKAGGKGDLKKNSALNAQIKDVSKSKDSWFAYALTSKMREKIGKGDPIADLSEQGKGKVNLGDLKAGNLTLDFESGLVVNSKSALASEASASALQAFISKNLDDAAKSDDVKSLGIEFLVKAVSVSSKGSNLLLGVKLSADEFDQVIALTTSLAQSVPSSGKSKPAAKSKAPAASSSGSSQPAKKAASSASPATK